MPLITVNIHPLATREYRKACRWYSRKSVQLENRFRTRIRQTINRIEDNPLQGSIHRQTYRFLKAAQFPFVIYYRQTAWNEWLVVAIAHASRKPDYWLRRS